MKAVISFVCWLAAISLTLSLQRAYAESPTGAGGVAAFVETVNAYKTDESLFKSKKPLTVHGRFGDYRIEMLRLTNCHPTTLSNVVAQLRRYDSDAEIPRIWRIFYDSCEQIIGAGDEGDIYIPNTAGGPVWITFQLQSLKRTKWKQVGGDSVFVGKPSTSAIAPPLAPGPLPCGGTVTRNDDTSITFPMCSKNPQPTYYAYALHLDQIGSDKIGVDIGIDPQIINRPP